MTEGVQALREKVDKYKREKSGRNIVGLKAYLLEASTGSLHCSVVTNIASMAVWSSPLFNDMNRRLVKAILKEQELTECSVDYVKLQDKCQQECFST